MNVSGELDQATVPQLREALDELNGDRGAVLIDLSDCEFVDSSGLAALVDAHGRININGGRLAVCCPRPAVYRVFQLTAVDESLGLHRSRDEALTALTG